MGKHSLILAALFAVVSFPSRLRFFGAQLAGMVVGPNAEPASGTLVQMIGADGRILDEFRSDENGRFKVEAPSDGGWLQARTAQRVSAPIEVAGTDTSVTLRLAGGLPSTQFDTARQIASLQDSTAGNSARTSTDDREQLRYRPRLDRRHTTDTTKRLAIPLSDKPSNIAIGTGPAGQQPAVVGHAVVAGPIVWRQGAKPRLSRRRPRKTLRASDLFRFPSHRWLRVVPLREQQHRPRASSRRFYLD